MLNLKLHFDSNYEAKYLFWKIFASKEKLSTLRERTYLNH